MMNELMKKLAAKGKSKMDDQEVQAKLDVIKELLEMAQDAMGNDVKSNMDEMMLPKKSVQVSAPDQEGLEAGLDMAKEIVSEDEEESSPEEAMMHEMHPEAEEEMEEDEEEMPKKKKAFPGLL